MSQINAKLIKTRRASAPSNPGVGDVWVESGPEIEWYWDGVRWMSRQFFLFSDYFSDVGAPATPHRRYPAEISAGVQYDLYIVDLMATMYTSGDLSSNYWIIGVSYEDTDLASTSLGSVNNQGNTSAKMVMEKTEINRFIDVSATGAVSLLTELTANGSPPGNLYAGSVLRYQLVRP